MNILLGISGGIAAYKACDIISGLKYNNHDIKVVITENGKRFITIETLASLTGHPVLCDMFEKYLDGSIEHIKVSQNWADLLVVAPATANIIGKFANGIADDYLSTIYMAATCKKIICPAMNTQMFNSPALTRNLKVLNDYGDIIMSPVEGKLACGDIGTGKLPNPRDIVAFIEKMAKDVR